MTTTRDMAVYLLLAIAADKGEPCPSNDMIAEAIGASRPLASKVVARLEAQGAIIVQRLARTGRVVTIVATGRSTAPPVTSQKRDALARRGEMAELVAEGMSIADAGRRMGLGDARSQNMWQQIRRDMGAQAC